MYFLRAAAGIALSAVFASGSDAAQYHVNKGIPCSDSGPATATQPLCTVQAGLQRLNFAGDELILHEGVYNECASLSRSVGLRGTATSPTVIRGADGADLARIVIDASNLTEAECAPAAVSCDTASRRAALTVSSAWSTPFGYLRLARFTVRPPNLGSTITKVNGVDVQCADNVEIIDVRSDFHPDLGHIDTGAEGGDAIFNFYNVKDMLVLDADISNGGTIVQGFQGFINQGGSGITIVGARARDLDGGFVCQSGGVQRIELLYNDVSNVNSQCDGANVIQAYNLDFLRVAYNRIVNHAGYVIRQRGYAWAAPHERVIFTNNLVRARGSGQTAVNFGYAADPDTVSLGIYRNNVFSGYTTAFSYETARVKDCDVTEDHNAFVGVGTIHSDASGCGFSKGANSLVLAANPLGSTDCPSTGTTVINTGYPLAAVPKGGASRVDLGACETGASAGAWVTPYDFQAGDSTTSATPRITWDGAADANINLKNLDFLRFLKGAPQTSYECEVDTVFTFNSQGVRKPRWTSGVVNSATTSCVVGQALPQGEYFARVRVNGQMWSDVFKFTVGTGTSGPVCGNGVKETGEACDGADLGGETCVTRGFTSGTLACTASCTYDTGGCASIAAAPTIAFLDVASAVAGSWVTIVGRGFGASQGSSQVLFGTTPATSVPAWSDTRIVAQVPAGAGSPVKVQIGAAISGGVPFSIHAGRVLWVAKNGSDGNACSSSAPCLTIDRARTLATPGDVVVVRAGTYCESSGGAGLYVRSANSGTASQPITYRNYPGESATIDCCGTCGGNTVFLEGSYIQISGLRATGARGTGFVIVGNSNRIADAESFGNNQAGYAATSGSGINIQVGSSNAKVLGCSIHDNGSVDNLDHGIYAKGQDMEIAYNKIFNHSLGYGMQLYEGSGATFERARVHGNLIYGNRNGGITVNLGAMNAEIFNNEIRQNTRYGILVGGSGASAPVGTKIVNNTVHDNDAAGGGYHQVRFQTGSGATFANNVLSGTNALMARQDSTATGGLRDFNQYGSNLAGSFNWAGTNYNFTGWRTTSGGDGSSAVGDPGYAAAGANDLHLGSGSPAIDTGSATYAPALDRDGKVRPQGSAPDRGAYESGGGGGGTNTPPLPVSNLVRTDNT